VSSFTENIQLIAVRAENQYRVNRVRLSGAEEEYYTTVEQHEWQWQKKQRGVMCGTPAEQLSLNITEQREHATPAPMSH